MNVLIGMTIVMALVALFALAVFWGTHISMVKNNSHSYGWGTYKNFIREFEKCSWSKENWDSSLFNYITGGYLHASIFKFNHKGMIMRDPISYLRAESHIRNYIKKHYQVKRNVVDWNKN